MPELTIAHQHTVVMEAEPSSRFLGFLHGLTDAVLFVLIFLFPLFYVPGLRDGAELPKQLLLLGGVTLVGVLWLVRVFIAKSITIRRSFLFFPVILLVVGLGIATLLSADRYVSLFGGALGEYTSFATLAGMALLLFFAASSPHDIGFVRRALLAFFASVGLVFLLAILKFMGISLPLLPAAAGWNPAGSFFGLGILGAGVLLLACGLLLFDRSEHAAFLGGGSGRALRILAAVSGVLALIYLLALDWWVAWTVTLVGSALLLTFVFVYAHSFKNIARLALPLISLVFAILFLLIRTPLQANFPVEITPSQTVSWEVVTKSLRQHPAFGSGPSTYAFNYGEHRPDLLLNSLLWNIRFGAGSSFVLSFLPTVGLVGGILWLLLIGVIAGFIVRSLIRERDQTAWLLTVAVAFPWVGMVLARFLYGANMTLEFLFWFLTMLIVIATSRRLSLFTFSSSPRALLGSSLGAVVFAALMVILLILGISRFAAWSAFDNALEANAARDTERMRTELVRATELDPRTDVFWRNLAQVRLFEAAQAQDIEELRVRLNAAVAAGRAAASVSPDNAQNWSMLGAVYREMAPVVGGAGQLGLDAFARAQELEPRNPVYMLEMGRINLIVADRDRAQTASEDRVVRGEAQARLAERLAEAERLLGEAVELKQDYGAAHFYLALALERQGKLADAISKMEAVVRFNPRDVGAMLQLSLLYLQNNEMDKAEAQLARALQLAPNYANAHWYLASIYERRGQFDKAIAEIEAVLATNPDGQAAKDRLAQLRAGQTAEGLPEPVGVLEEERRFPQ